MNKCKVVSFLLLMLFASLTLMPRVVYATAVVWTDKADYEFWETVTIYGSGFNPNTNIGLTITRPDSVVETGSAMSNAYGSFVYYYVLNGMFGTYTVAATDGVISASTTFLETRYHLEGYTRLPHAKWTTGVLKGWYECENVPYRLKMIDVDTTTYTLSNYHDNMLGGIPGIDECLDFYVGYEDGSPAPSTEVTIDSITGPHYQTPVAITEIYYTWTVTYTSTAVGKTYYLHWKAHLAFGSHGWPGAKLHGKTDATGAQDVPIMSPPATPIPPPPPAIHLDAESELFPHGLLIHPADIGTIMSVEWHEIYPSYCNWYHIFDWIDEGDGLLGYCDHVKVMEDMSWYHVEKVTITLFLISEETGEPMYIEFYLDYLDFPFGMPVSTMWHEVYPSYCNWYHLIEWLDNDNGELDYCDYILLEPTDPIGPVEMWHVEKVKTDILITKCPDFGDAPDPFIATAGEYSSLLDNNGARHLEWNYEWLGSNVNGELDSKQVDLDEFDDGVSTLGSNLVPGGNLKLTITVSTSGGPYNLNDPNDVLYLNAWIDWNRDGDWQDTNEKIIGTWGKPYGTQKFAGPATTVYNIPIPASVTPDETYWLRFRLDYAEDAGANPQPWTDPSLNQEKGPAMFGEVEDYEITIEEAPPAAICIVKKGPSMAHEGDTITYTYEVTNPGDCELTPVTVSDNVAGPASYVSGDTDIDGKLDPGETWIFTASYFVPSPSGDITNTATASGKDPSGSTVTNQDTLTVKVLHPDINVVKTGPSLAHEGDTITYTYTVTNPGDCELSGVTVSDSLPGVSPAFVNGDTDIDGKLDPGETWIFKVSYTVPSPSGDITNIATASGTDPLGKPVSNTDKWTVTVEAPPPRNLKAVSQSASPSTVIPGGTVHMTVKVENTGTITETFDVDLKYDSTLLHTWTGVTLGAGVQTDLTWDWITSSVPPGTYSITGVVDPTDAIAETDETDNTCTVPAAVTIESPPAPPPAPPVGGKWVPIDKFRLLAPWIGLASASLIVVVTISVVYVKHRKKERN